MSRSKDALRKHVSYRHPGTPSPCDPEAKRKRSKVHYHPIIKPERIDDPISAAANQLFANLAASQTNHQSLLGGTQSQVVTNQNQSLGQNMNQHLAQNMNQNLSQNLSQNIGQQQALNQSQNLGQNLDLNPSPKSSINPPIKLEPNLNSNLNDNNNNNSNHNDNSNLYNTSQSATENSKF